MKNALLKTLVVAAMAFSANAFAGSIGGDFEAVIITNNSTNVGGIGIAAKQIIAVGGVGAGGNVGGKVKTTVIANNLTNVGCIGIACKQEIRLAQVE